MMKTNTFKGYNVFMSRKLVPPEIYDALLDALKLNGADVFPCCDPSRNSPNDYHVISSPDHEKFEDLRAKGCNLIGPQCVLSCAKEHKQFPKQGFTCCLAMDGVKVLVSGYDINEKGKLEKMVKAMGGLLCSKPSLDVSFVIVKNVLAAKYKWALNVLKKPIVTASWLYQCSTEHRVVPQELYRVHPFSGLTICVTGIIGVHICFLNSLYAPRGDKFQVAVRWGNINIVTRKWLDQSVAKRACLNEESYPVQGGSAPSTVSFRSSLGSQYSLEKSSGQLTSGKPSAAVDSNPAVCQSSGLADSDVEATLSQNMSSMFSDASIYIKKDDKEVPSLQPTNETSFSNYVASDSQSEDNDLYLADCRIALIGFETSELRKLVNMVRNGGGSRYMTLNDKLTHIIIGAPTEDEKKELRSLAASGVINVVRKTWLEDCDREKREIPIQGQHMAYELLLLKDSLNLKKGSLNSTRKSSIPSVQSDQLNVESGRPDVHSHQLLGRLDSLRTAGFPPEQKKEEKQENNVDGVLNLNATSRQIQKKSLPFDNVQKKNGKRIHHDLDDTKSQSRKLVAVFMGKTFCFSKAFPADRRTEVVEWITQGGGELIDDETIQNVQFTVECHGVITSSANNTCFVSSHWVRSCLEDGQLLDVDSHILYSPLPCKIPFPDFGSFRFCVSQFDEKEKSLLRNLCFVLGVKFAEKLTKKVTHLLCKFRHGPKYEAACKWGITSVTLEWIYECVRKDKVVDLTPFCPKEVTQQDQDDGLCTVSQFPSQTVWKIPGETSSQLRSQSQDVSSLKLPLPKKKISSMEGAQEFIHHSKKARNVQPDEQTSLPSSGVYSSDSILNINSIQGFNITSATVNISKDCRDSSRTVPDVAAAIEDLLEQTSKIHDQKSPERTSRDENLLTTPECPTLDKEDRGGPSSVNGLPNDWLNRYTIVGPAKERNNPTNLYKTRIKESITVSVKRKQSPRLLAMKRTSQVDKCLSTEFELGVASLEPLTYLAQPPSLPTWWHASHSAATCPPSPAMSRLSSPVVGAFLLSPPTSIHVMCSGDGCCNSMVEFRRKMMKRRRKLKFVVAAEFPKSFSLDLGFDHNLNDQSNDQSQSPWIGPIPGDIAEVEAYCRIFRAAERFHTALMNTLCNPVTGECSVSYDFPPEERPLLEQKIVSVLGAVLSLLNKGRKDVLSGRSSIMSSFRISDVSMMENKLPPLAVFRSEMKRCCESLHVALENYLTPDDDRSLEVWRKLQRLKNVCYDSGFSRSEKCPCHTLLANWDAVYSSSSKEETESESSEAEFWMGGQVTEEALNWLLVKGFKTIVDLRAETIQDNFYKAAIDDAILSGKVELIHIPVEVGTAPSVEQVELFASLVSDFSKRPIYIHSKEGVQRTSAMVSRWRLFRTRMPPQLANLSGTVVQETSEQNALQTISSVDEETLLNQENGHPGHALQELYTSNGSSHGEVDSSVTFAKAPSIKGAVNGLEPVPTSLEPINTEVGSVVDVVWETDPLKAQLPPCNVFSKAEMSRFMESKKVSPSAFSKHQSTKVKKMLFLGKNNVWKQTRDTSELLERTNGLIASGSSSLQSQRSVFVGEKHPKSNSHYSASADVNAPNTYERHSMSQNGVSTSVDKSLSDHLGSNYVRNDTESRDAGPSSSSEDELGPLEGDMCASTTGVVRVQSRKKAEMFLVRTDGFSCTREKVTESSLAFSHPSTQQQMLMWKSPPKTVLLLKKLGQELMEEAKQVASFLYHQEKLNVVVEPDVHDIFARIPGFGFIQTFYSQDISDLHERIDFVACLGGDGVILHASNLFRDAVPPVVSFNLGSLGFLTSHSFEDYRKDLKQLIHVNNTVGVYITLRMRLTCEIFRHGQAVPGKVFEVLNEVVVDRGSNPYLSKIECYEHDRLITKVQGDGVIVATPTGSTAYSTSAGGSMVHPNVPCMLFTPICPHSLSFRPVILPDSARLELKIPEDARSNAWVSFDGKRRQQLSRGDSVKISMSQHPLPTVNKYDQTGDWFHSLVRCLNWNERLDQKAL
ncbi:NAD kinase 2, chloroplastic [Linum perenne]